MKRLSVAVATACIISVFSTLFPLAAAAQHATHSVLNNGSWWKVEIRSNGIYRIDANTVDGIDGCNIQDVALFGMQGGPMSVYNSDPRIDDLQEVAVEMHDTDQNGIFNNNDFILFYATGPDRWVFDSDMQRYEHTPHPYSAANHLFLTAKSGSHRRIATTDAAASSSDAITLCHHLALHDNDLVNTAKTGQIWVGERFYGGATQHTFNFTLPATPTGNVKLRYGLASLSTSSSNFTVSAGNQTMNHVFNSRSKYNTFTTEFQPTSSQEVAVTINYHYNESLASGYLDFIEVDATVPMTANSGMATFFVDASDNAVHKHIVNTSISNLRIWDVSDFNSVRAMATSRDGNSLVFNDTTNTRRCYMAFTESDAVAPQSITAIPNQDLHGAAIPDMVIVCNGALVDEANRLAQIHSLYDNLDVLTVTQEQVFNEFSSGQTDPVAIREFLRMFWQRAASQGVDSPSHLVLFGKGTYDNKDLLGHGLPTVVTYETLTSFDNDYSYASDDFFTFLEENESGTIYESLDIAVGRIPAKSSAEANHIIDKIERYITRADLLHDEIRGDWRNVVALLSDDADPSSSGDTIFTRSSEITANQILEKYPHYNIDKIYADAYIQQSGADGSYYPDANNALEKRINYGCLLLNYIGHGSSQYIGTERFMMKSNISNYTNYYQLPFFVTSTCTFGRYDDPDETSGAEEFLLANGAGIGCLAASRPISHIQIVNTDMVMQSLNPENTIGQAIRTAKNHRPTTMALTLMGDPALQLSFPQYKVVVTSINGRAVDSLRADSAMVLSTVTVEGEIRDNDGNLVHDFNGTIYPEVYDRPVSTHTLANDNEGCEVTFSQQNSLLYKGRTEVTGGRFSYHFIVPRDVAYKYAPAKLCHYAKSATEDATGAYLNLYLGGFDENADLSESRPDIRLFIGDTNFRNGGITDQTPTLLALFFDSIGINAVGSGLGHDITATIDNNQNNIIILNDLYETDIDDEHRGSIRYSLTALAPGRHTVTVKAWNIYNYSNSTTLTFYVHGKDTVCSDFHADPNPATDKISLAMELSSKGSIVSASLQIFDSRGACLRVFTPSTGGDGYVVGPVEWDLTTGVGRRVTPGVYIARFIATTADGEQIVEHGKIIVK